MVTLASASGRSLVPDLDFSGTLEKILKRQDIERKEQREIQTQEDIQKNIDILSGGGGDFRTGGFAPPSKAEERALNRIGQLDPKLGKFLLDARTRGDERELAEVKRQAERGAKQAVFISGQKDFASKQRAITRIGEEMAVRGESLDRIIKLQNMSEPELDLELQRMQIMGQDIKRVLPSAVAGGKSVQSSKILPGGLVQIVFKDGSTEVRPATPENIKLIEAAEQRGTTLAVERAGGKAKAVAEEKVKVAVTPIAAAAAATPAAAKAAITASTKAFEKLAPIKQSIVNIDEAIKLVDEGAGTGPILSRLPSIRSASIKLDNVQKAMGLDVIGTTTFGALSKGELDLALSKALPTNLRGPALREWLVEKKAAQEKLSVFLEKAATFLGTPGNTIAGFIESEKAAQSETPLITTAPQEGATATNPTTGEQIIFRDGQWETL